MTQLHTVHQQIGVVRPTNDIDIVLHVETRRGVASMTAQALEDLGCQLQAAVDPRNNTAHRFVRGASKVDVVTGTRDSVDVLLADHPAPTVIETLRGRDMVQIEGGTQALRRTVNAEIEITPGTMSTISVPRPYAAVILKSAAYTTDTRDRDRYLYDAAALLACVEDPFAEREVFAGSDRARLATLQRALPQEHPAWRALPREARATAASTLRILSSSH